MIRRLVFASTLAALMLMLALPAQAKLPPYEMDVSTNGLLATVTVRFLDFDGEGALTDDFLPESLDGVMAWYPASALESDGRPSLSDHGMPLSMARIATGVYEASFEVPAAGEWAIVPFPGNDMPSDLYPVVVFAASPAAPPIGAVVALVVALGVAVLLAVQVRRRRTVAAGKPSPAAV